MTIKGFTRLGQTHIKGSKDFAPPMDQLIAEARADTRRQAQPGGGDSLKKPPHAIDCTTVC